MSLPTSPGVEFRLIPSHPRYCIGTDCSVWRRKGKSFRSKDWSTWEVRKPYPHGDYLWLTVDGKLQFVHRLMLFTFKPDGYFEGAITRHLNGNGCDNRLENIVWGTDAENGRDQVRLGESHFGEKNSKAILCEGEVLLIAKLVRRHPGQSGITNFLKDWFGVSQGTISHISTGRTWGYLNR